MKKKILAVVLSVCVAVAFTLTIQTSPASAVETDHVVNLSKKITVFYYGTGVSDWNYYELDMGSRIYGADDFTMKSSDKTVVKPGSDDTAFIAKKAGTAKLTISIKKGKKTKRYKSTVKVVKYQNPAKKFKIGKKSYTAKLKKPAFKDFWAEMKVKKGKAKISIKPKKDWKVKKIRYWWEQFDADGDLVKRSDKKVKNNSKITIYKGENYDSGLIITMTNKKLKLSQQYELDINP